MWVRLFAAVSPVGCAAFGAISGLTPSAHVCIFGRRDIRFGDELVTGGAIPARHAIRVAIVLDPIPAGQRPGVCALLRLRRSATLEPPHRLTSQPMQHGAEMALPQATGACKRSSNARNVASRCFSAWRQS